MYVFVRSGFTLLTNCTTGVSNFKEILLWFVIYVFYTIEKLI